MAEASFWTAEEVDVSQDAAHWRDRLHQRERNLLEKVLAFFACADGIVGENMVENFAAEVTLPEARCFYGFQVCGTTLLAAIGDPGGPAQIMIENVHAEMYSILLDTYVQDSNAKIALFQAVDNDPVVRLKAQWALKWLDASKSFGLRLVAFAVVEGIFFSGGLPAMAACHNSIRRQLPSLSFEGVGFETDLRLSQKLELIQAF